MKTSTIILVSFLVIVFLTPLFVALALQRKISNSEYTLLKNEKHEDRRNLKMGNFKVLSIKSNSTHLNCSIIKGDSSFISYEDWRADNISLKRNGDTIHVMYMDPDIDQGNRDHFGIQIHVQNPGAIISEKAAVEIVPDNFYNNHPLEIFVRNEAKLVFLNSPVANHVEADGPERDTSTNNMSFNQIAITADDAEVRLPSSLKVGSLMLDISNKSKLVLPAGMKFQQVTANISDDTEVQAPWHVVKSFKTTAGNK